mgnify:CR=1 FL=1
MKKLILVLLFVPLISFGQIAKDYFDSGLSKAKSGDYSGAFLDFTKAIELKPDDAMAYSNRGLAKNDLKDLSGACDDWRRAANLGHSNAAKWVKDQCN